MISREILKPEESCPRCREGRLKSWKELSEDEKMFAESLPASAEWTRLVRRTHFFCTKCWYEAKPSLTLA